MADEGRWQAVGDPVPEGWSVGVVDKQRNVVWVAPPGWTPPPPDLNQPWPGRPSNEVPRASFRLDGTCKSVGYAPGGKGSFPDAARWSDVELPWVLVPQVWIKTVAELEAHIAPIRAQLAAG